MTDLADLRLTEWTACGGCAAKWGAAPLSQLVRDLAGSADPALLVGLAPFDDAAVYRVSDDLAIVSTTDFFPRSLTTRATSVPSPPPTPAATCSPWAAGW